MLPLLVLAAIMLAGGVIVGRFRAPRPIDARMLIGGLMIVAGIIFFIQGVEAAL